MFYFHPLHLANYADYAFYKGAFSKEECEKIKGLWDDDQAGVAHTGQGSDCLLTHLPNEIRKSKTSWIEYNQEADWLFRKLHQYALDCNGARYGFELSGFLEKLQLTRYDEGDHYGWHQDNGAGAFSVRKLSIVVQLTDSSDYEGGELEFLTCGKASTKEQGDLIFFPSYQGHKVNEVTKGTRYSLVAWITGPAYR